MLNRYQVVEMPRTFIAQFCVVDTANHPTHFEAVSNDALDLGHVELFDFEDEAIVHAEFCNA